jgi:hypothetical protein
MLATESITQHVLHANNIKLILEGKAPCFLHKKSQKQYNKNPWPLVCLSSKQFIQVLFYGDDV